jgi:NadR type nicotinamide-nucleotide adenylyltransferase
MQASPADHHDAKKVVVIGPECTGKSELSQFLATHFKTVCVDEYARAYLSKLNKPYEQADLTKIAHGQSRMEDEWLNDANRVMICDTNAIVIKVWSDYKYGNSDPEILHLIAERKYDLYLLTYVDIPWQEDPLREHPDKREYFWKTFYDEITKTGVPFIEIKGAREERQAKAITAVENILTN